jgi:16S rRNA (guanine527-N7)-methyltransferase
MRWGPFYQPGLPGGLRKRWTRGCRLAPSSMSPSGDREAALRLAPVSRETLTRLDLYVALLAKWRRTINLISDATFTEVWTRHIADSAQLLSLAPSALTWVDMGSGAGFPGLILAMQLADHPGACIHLIESDQRKAAFLREAARVTGAVARIHSLRVEEATQEIVGPVDAVTARALAPLPRLLGLSKIWLEQGATGVFPRGRTEDMGIEELSDYQKYEFDFPRSRIDPRSHIAVVRRKPDLSSIPARGDR